MATMFNIWDRKITIILLDTIDHKSRFEETIKLINLYGKILN